MSAYPQLSFSSFQKWFAEAFILEKNDKNNDLAEKNTSQDEAGVVRVEDGRRRFLQERRPVRQSRRRPGRRRQREHQQSEEHA